MTRFERPIVYFLLLGILINMGAWTFNTELFNGLGFDHSDKTPLTFSISADTEFGLHQPSAIPSASQDTCNHGCHALSHFMGQIVEGYGLVTVVLTTHFLPPLLFLFACLPDSQFRPPQHPSRT